MSSIINEEEDMNFTKNLCEEEPFYLAQPVKLQKKQCEGVYFCVYGTAFPMPIQQKLPPPVLLFSDFAGWVRRRNVAGLSG